ncbi:hypothetical protein ACHMW6_17350 [Pseudoduganella sp. UC29_106]|uniref:hypothetical protein n=1 Tax=Pseudoduganella sp. UC29_106 TaxID=3374553 RepID=UPI003756DA9B
MATIVIKDLPENVDLDRAAMRALVGGSRFRGAAGAARPVARRIQLFDLSRGRPTKAPPTR